MVFFGGNDFIGPIGGWFGGGSFGLAIVLACLSSDVTHARASRVRDIFARVRVRVRPVEDRAATARTVKASEVIDAQMTAPHPSADRMNGGIKVSRHYSATTLIGSPPEPCISKWCG